MRNYVENFRSVQDKTDTHSKDDTMSSQDDPPNNGSEEHTDGGRGNSDTHLPADLSMKRGTPLSTQR